MHAALNLTETAKKARMRVYELYIRASLAFLILALIILNCI